MIMATWNLRRHRRLGCSRGLTPCAHASDPSGGAYAGGIQMSWKDCQELLEENVDVDLTDAREVMCQISINDLPVGFTGIAENRDTAWVFTISSDDNSVTRTARLDLTVTEYRELFQDMIDELLTRKCAAPDLYTFFAAVPDGHCACDIPRSQCSYHRS